MNRPKFPLESVLVLRRFHKAQAAGRLASATRGRLEQENQLRMAQTEIHELEGELSSLLQHDVLASRILLLRHLIDHLGPVIKRHRKALIEAQKEEQECRDILLKHQAEEKSVLRLKEKHHDELNKELRRLDERASEDCMMAGRLTNNFSL